MKRLVVSLVGLALLALGVLWLSGDGFAQPKKGGEANPDGPRAHFKHADHAGYGVDTSAKGCPACHSIDVKGVVSGPAAQGHAPCLQAGCHAETFLVISEKNQKNPAMAEKWGKASGFCLACHEQVPWAWKKPTVRVLQAWQNQREFHIEMSKSTTSNMDHYGHTQAKKKDGSQVGCRDCHAVDATTFKLVDHTPGHGQCVQCHNPTAGVAFAMNDCARCHKEGSRDEFLRKILADRGKVISDKDAPSRPDADVRSCGSGGEDAYKKKGHGKVPCFRHETKEHREDKTGNGVQCGKCHYLIVNKAAWAGRSYASVGDLHLNKIIGDKPNDSRSMQHTACAGCHPHDSQVKLRGGNCQFCHAERTVQEPYW